MMDFEDMAKEVRKRIEEKKKEKKLREKNIQAHPHPFITLMKEEDKRGNVLPEHIYEEWTRIIGYEDLKAFLEEAMRDIAKAQNLPEEVGNKVSVQNLMRIFAAGYFIGSQEHDPVKVVDKLLEENNIKVKDIPNEKT